MDRLLKSTWSAKLEIILVATLFPLHALWYNFLGRIAALEKVNYERYFQLPSDTMYPMLPILSLFYMFVWVYPFILYIYLVVKLWPDYAKFRRIYIGFLVLILVSYAIWLAIPNEDTHRISESVLLSYGWTGKVTAFVYQVAAIWNSFPSFHTETVWFCYRLLRVYIKKSHWIALTIVIITMITVLAIRVHDILDLVGGVLLAEIVIQLVVKPLENRKAFSKGSHVFWCSLYLAIFVIAVALKIVLEKILHI